MKIEEMVVKHSAWIHKKAKRYYSDCYEADNLASETIYKCLNNGARFDSERSFKPWVLAIMENTYITQYNRSKCVLFTSLYEPDLDFPSREESASQRVRMHRIFSIVRSCARKSRCIDCVILYAKGFRYDEIADIESIPIGTVKSRIATGRKMLREALEI